MKKDKFVSVETMLDEICKIAHALGIIGIEPGVKTHLGTVDSVTCFGELLEYGMEEHCIGSLAELTDEELKKVYSASLKSHVKCRNRLASPHHQSNSVETVAEQDVYMHDDDELPF